MYFFKYKTKKIVNINVHKHLIVWNEAPSKQQQILQDFLYPFWKNKIICAEFPIPGSKFKVDILNVSDKIAIEYSPSSTHDFNEFFHNNRASFVRRVHIDIRKIEELERNNFTVLELTEDDLPQLSKDYFLTQFKITL